MTYTYLLSFIYYFLFQRKQKSQVTHGTYLFTDRCFLPDLTELGEILLRGAWRFKFYFMFQAREFKQITIGSQK